MQERLEQISNEIDWIIGVLLLSTFAISVGIVWNIAQESIVQRNIFEGIGIIVALVSVCATQYRAKKRHEKTEQQISELRKDRLRPEHKERVEIIDESINKAKAHIERLNGKRQFTLELDPILLISELEPYHIDYFESEYPDFVKELREYEDLRRTLVSTHQKARKELREHAERYAKENSKSELDPTEWLIEEILSFSRTSREDIEEKFDVRKSSEKVKIMNEISETQRTAGSGIFLHKPQPVWLTEYVEAKEAMTHHLIQQIETLSEIRQDQNI